MYSSDERLAGLKISNLELSDEAVYRCDITYLQINDGCPVVQFVNLTVHGKSPFFLPKPSNPPTTTLSSSLIPVRAASDSQPIWRGGGGGADSI